MTLTTDYLDNVDVQKAFAYIRVSGKGQIEGDGFDRQIVAIQRYAKANDIKIVKFFREEGVSGATELDNRPALSELVEALHANGVKTVLIENLSRLARMLMIQESILADFQREGFTLISVDDPNLCEDDPTRVAFRQMMGVFSQYEKSMIVAKLRGARQRKRQRDGRCEGRKPFGTREGEQVIIDRMVTLKGQGLAIKRIALILNEERLPSRTGKPWTDVSVARIVGRATGGADSSIYPISIGI